MPSVVSVSESHRIWREGNKLAQISKRKKKALIGEEFDLVLEGTSEETDLLLEGRTAMHAPEIDGTVRIAGDKASAGRLAVGSMAEVQITGAGQYDLEARLL